LTSKVSFPIHAEPTQGGCVYDTDTDTIIAALRDRA
jgi:hypothetical protein